MWNIFGGSDKLVTPKSGDTLSGRSEVMPLPDFHYVKEVPLVAPFPEGSDHILFGMGCFWGAERKFWEMTGVYTSAVGYVGGYTPNPTYQEVCSGQTGHTEAVLVVFFPAEVSLEQVLRTFWENHDPTQGMRQGNDVGTQYRSGIYFNTDHQHQAAEDSQLQYQKLLSRAGFDRITTEIVSADHFYYAEEYHQQYLAKNPTGYCGLGGTGVACPIGLTD